MQHDEAPKKNVFDLPIAPLAETGNLREDQRALLLDRLRDDPVN